MWFSFGFLALLWHLFNSPAGLPTAPPDPWAAVTDSLRSGDLIFQASLSSQSKAIQLATHSPYSHCGVVYRQGNKWVVFEAVEPVKTTALSNWIRRGEGQHFVVKRLKNADQVLTSAVLARMKKIGESMKGKKYDLAFHWSDERIYCSELIWKMYQRATGLEIGRLQQLRDFDLSHPEVQKKLRERYGNQVPLDEPVISPAAVFESDLLRTVLQR
jgi:hypothetical protein